MMDKNTAVEILRSNYIDYAPPIMGCKPISARRCEDIANFIEQQEKYAELGRLALEVLDINNGIEDTDFCSRDHLEMWKGKCVNCCWIPFCQKRAELLTGGNISE